MRQLDLFEPVENTKPQTNTTNGKVGGKTDVAPVQSPKNGVAANEGPKIVAIKEQPTEQKKKEKEPQVQKESGTNSKRGRKSFKEMDADIVMVEVPDDEILFQKNIMQ